MDADFSILGFFDSLNIGMQATANSLRSYLAPAIPAAADARRCI